MFASQNHSGLASKNGLQNLYNNILVLFRSLFIMSDFLFILASQSTRDFLLSLIRGTRGARGGVALANLRFSFFEKVVTKKVYLFSRRVE